MKEKKIGKKERMDESMYVRYKCNKIRTRSPWKMLENSDECNWN